MCPSITVSCNPLFPCMLLSKRFFETYSKVCVFVQICMNYLYIQENICISDPLHGWQTCSPGRHPQSRQCPQRWPGASFWQWRGKIHSVHARVTSRILLHLRNSQGSSQSCRMSFTHTNLMALSMIFLFGKNSPPVRWSPLRYAREQPEFWSATRVMFNMLLINWGVIFWTISFLL